MRLLLMVMLIGLLPPIWTPAQSQDNLPRDYVVSQRGDFTQGGLVVLELAANTALYLNGGLVPQANQFAVFGFDRDAPLAQKLRFVRGDASRGDAIYDAHINLVARQYAIQHIEGVPPKYVSPAPQALRRIRREGRRKRQARNIFHQADWFAAGFVLPVRGKITGVYGSQRTYNGKPRRPHYGIDIAAPHGTPVKAAAAGYITLAQGDMYFEGGLVFINHGLFLTSAYLHLHTLAVQEGDFVNAGDVIGTVGAGGRSTGAHLDWRVFWRGARIDPSLLVD